MDTLPKSRLLGFVERAVELARRAVERFSTRYSRKRSTLRQHVVLLCLKVKKATTYRDLVDELIEMPRIRDTFDLDSIPAPSTLCKAFDRLEMPVWRVLLNVSLVDLPLNGVPAWKQFRELVIECVVHNLERALAMSHEEEDHS